jgi:hypothetical protein
MPEHVTAEKSRRKGGRPELPQSPGRQQQGDSASVQETGDVQRRTNGVNILLTTTQRDGWKTVSKHPIGIQSAVADA